MARSTPPTRGASRPELRIHSAAAQTRTISAGTFCRSQWELSQYLKYMARSRIPEFESSHPSQPVRSLCDMSDQRERAPCDTVFPWPPGETHTSTVLHSDPPGPRLHLWGPHFSRFDGRNTTAKSAASALNGRAVGSVPLARTFFNGVIARGARPGGCVTNYFWSRGGYLRFDRDK
jgi:hypothetical protein